MSRVRTRDLSFELQAGETLLESLERTGHSVEYQCRSGYCGACRTPLLAGRVTYHEPPLAYVAEGEILPCCCRPAEPVSLDIPLLEMKQQA